MGCPAAYEGTSITLCTGFLAHDHPTGVTEECRADRMLTAALKQARATLDIAVLDVVAAHPCQ
jgi:DNA repair protein RadC